MPFEAMFPSMDNYVYERKTRNNKFFMEHIMPNMSMQIFLPSLMVTWK